MFRDYEVILAAGDGKLDDTDENQKSFDRVKAAIAHHEKDHHPVGGTTDYRRDHPGMVGGADALQT